MSYIVGKKGQIVISKEIRDLLGVQPGWTALQKLVDDHVEVYFIPPAHNRSLKGSLSKYLKPRSDFDEEDWTAIRDKAGEDAVKEEADLWEPTH